MPLSRWPGCLPPRVLRCPPKSCGDGEGLYASIHGRAPARKAMRIAIVVPTLNEEATIARTLPAAQAALAPLAGDELVVSDGGSADRTVEVARSLGVRVVTGP